MNVCVEEQTKIKFNVLFNKFDILSCLDHSDGIRVGVTVLFMNQQRKNLIFLVFAHFTTTPKWHVLTLLKQLKKNATALVIDRLTSRTPLFSRAVNTHSTSGYRFYDSTNTLNAPESTLISRE